MLSSQSWSAPRRLVDHYQVEKQGLAFASAGLAIANSNAAVINYLYRISFKIHGFFPPISLWIETLNWSTRHDLGRKTMIFFNRMSCTWHTWLWGSQTAGRKPRAVSRWGWSSVCHVSLQRKCRASRTGSWWNELERLGRAGPWRWSSNTE